MVKLVGRLDVNSHLNVIFADEAGLLFYIDSVLYSVPTSQIIGFDELSDMSLQRIMSVTVGEGTHGKIFPNGKACLLYLDPEELVRALEGTDVLTACSIRLIDFNTRDVQDIDLDLYQVMPEDDPEVYHYVKMFLAQNRIIESY